MAQYHYRVRMAEGQINTGMLQASTASEALEKARKLGGIPLEVTPVVAKKAFVLFGKRGVGLKDRIIFTEQLAVMLNAGITLVQALKGLQEEATNKTLNRILAALQADVESGIPFSEALAKHPSTFSGIYCQMVKSAEQSGNVADVLRKLTIQQQKDYDLRGKVKGALIYPAIVSVLLVGVIILVITFILPKLTGIFAESGSALPASTRFLLALSDFLLTKWYLVIIGIAVAVVAFKYALTTKQGTLFFDTVKIKFPVIGNFIRKSYMARFCQNFASLAQAGIPVLDVFAILKGVIGNEVYARDIERISKDVENGIKVSTAIRKSKQFPGMVGQLVSVGEQSGDLAGIFQVLGDFFEKEVDSMAKNLSTLLEPLIMVVMGAAIGFVLIAVLQPIYGLVNAV